MNRIKKYFGEINMKWIYVIIFAVIAAVYTAAVNIIPVFEGTSFRDIAVYPDCWILFAVFIIVNCKKVWEASLKCFVFFLISQPLIYLIEAFFLPVGWNVFGYYKYWFIITLLTLPGAAIAFLVKKKNWLSILVLSVANGYLAYAASDYIAAMSTDFPSHLLSSIFCIALIFFFVFVLFDKKSHKTAAICIAAVIFIVSFIFANTGKTTELYFEESNWTYNIENNDIVSVNISDGNRVVMKAKHNGGTYVYFTDSNGNKKTYYVTVSGGGVWADLIE